MKNLILLFLLCQSTLSIAQNNSKKIPDFKSNHIVKILKFFDDDVFKYVKIKDKDTKSKISVLLSTYNLKMDEITLLNRETMEVSEVKVNEYFKSYQLTKNANGIKENMQKILELLNPIKDNVEIENKKLDASFKLLLSKKQLKKWFKFKSIQLKKIMPKAEIQKTSQQFRPSGVNGMNRNARNRGLGGF